MKLQERFLLHLWQISQRGVVLQTYSQIRAISKVFFRGCCFCMSPAWDAPVLLATSCMADTCQGGKEASLLLAISAHVKWETPIGATMEAPVLLAIQPRVGNFSTAARAALQQVCAVPLQMVALLLLVI